jgi:hypothetical protein
VRPSRLRPQADGTRTGVLGRASCHLNAVELLAADRLDILELLAKADAAAGQRNATAYSDLFVADAVLDGAQGRYEGRTAIAESVGPIWAREGPASVHLTLNAVLASSDDVDHVVASSTLLIVAPGGTPGAPGVVLGIAAITQHVVRTAGGWRIARRTVSAV